MEPNRYWLLYFGLLFVFLGSNVGKAFCSWVSSILRAFLYASLALAAAALAKLLWELSSLLLRIATAHTDKQDGRAAESAHKSLPEGNPATSSSSRNQEQAMGNEKDIY